MGYSAGDHILALADDLSGAAETAAVLLPAVRGAHIDLGSDSGANTAHNAHTLVVKDLDSRQLSATEAGRVVHQALAAHTTQSPLIFIKLDSLLRGHVAATLRAARDEPVVVAPALPGAGRTVVDGVVRLDGISLNQSGTWHAEAAAPPDSIAAALTPLPCRTIPLDAVRSTRLSAWLAESITAGAMPVCDSETDADLDAIVAAAAEIPGVRLAGSGGLAASLGRALGSPDEPPTPQPDSGHALLFVVGTADAGAHEQVRQLTRFGVTSIVLDACGEHDSAGDRIATALADGPVVLTIDEGGAVRPGRSTELIRRLTATVTHSVERANSPVDLVLTGGETARRVLDALEIVALSPIGQVHHGAVHSRAPSGISVLTRPGSFGDSSSLVQILDHLRPNLKG